MTTNDSISKDGEKGVKNNMTAFLPEEYASTARSLLIRRYNADYLA